MTTAAEFIAGFEGYVERAYWDQNAFRLGYGSDTEGPEQIPVTEGMTTTKERALANLEIRIKQFAHEAIYGKNGMGADTWLAITENQRTAILSIVYNYGRLPSRVVVLPSEPERTAASIRSLQSDNAGVNRRRRFAEAHLYLVGASREPQPAPPAPIPQVPVPQAPAPIQPAPPPSPGLPPIAASSAGRRVAVLDNLTAMRSAYLAERASIDAEIAILDTTIADFGKLEAMIVPAALPKPDVPTPQRSNKMLGPNWVTTVFGTGSIAGAVVTVILDLVNKQTPDAASISLIFSSLMAGLGLVQAKDKNVTGGTVPQTKEAAARATSPSIR